MKREINKTMDKPMQLDQPDANLESLPKLAPVNEIYFMTFRNGMSPFNIKGFHHKGDLRSARNRAFAHGSRMNYKNIWVFPLVSDLDELEKAHAYTGESFVSGPESNQA